MQILNITTLITVIGILVGLTNLITQVLKQILWSKIPSSLLAVVIALALTLVAFFAYCTINTITVVWYYVVAAVVLGFMVAYAAMFGFDKLKEIIDNWFKKTN